MFAVNEPIRGIVINKCGIVINKCGIVINKCAVSKFKFVLGFLIMRCRFYMLMWSRCNAALTLLQIPPDFKR